MLEVVKKEWLHFFSSPAGTGTMVLFALVNGALLFVFPATSLLEYGYANLDLFFKFMPWLLVFLVPAVTMRSFAAEKQAGTLDLLLVKPFYPVQWVVAKWWGQVLIIWTALLPCWLYAFSLQAMSAGAGLDWGATVGSYLGLFLVAAVFCAIGLFASAVQTNVLGAFGLGVFFCLLVFAGWDALASLPFLPTGTAYRLAQLGMAEHSAYLSRGLFLLADALYFLFLVGVFLLLTEWVLVKDRQKTTPKLFLRRVTAGRRGVLLLLLFLAALVNNWFPLRWDLTQDQRYALSPSTKTLLKGLDSTVEVKIFLAGNLPPDYRKLADATRDMLLAFNREAAHPIRFRFEDPVADLTDDSARYKVYDSLARLGVAFETIQTASANGNQRTEQLIVPSALVHYRAGQAPLPIDLRSSKKLYKPYNVLAEEPQEDVEATRNAAEALLENKLATAIQQITRTHLPAIAYVVGHGEPTDLRVNDLGESLRRQYRLGVLDLTKTYPDPAVVPTLLVVRPTAGFGANDLLKLDQYVMRGGNIIWAIDALYAELDSLKNTNGSYVAFDRNLGLDELLFRYGVRINKDLVQDLNCAKMPLVIGQNPDGSPRMQRVPWPYYPFLFARSAHPIVQNLDRVLPVFPSSIDTVSAPGIQKTILLSTDSTSRRLGSPAVVALNSVRDENDLRSFVQPHVPVAVLVEGRFRSLFANRLMGQALDSFSQQSGKAFFAQGQAVSKQIVVADADLFTNAVSATTGPLPMGMVPMENLRFGNRDFFLNCVDYLSNPLPLYESRNKQVTLRLLDPQKKQAQKTFWQTLNTVVPALFFLLLGMGLRAWRKKQFVTP